jgi:hypothetical protein
LKLVTIENPGFDIVLSVLTYGNSDVVKIEYGNTGGLSGREHTK